MKCSRIILIKVNLLPKEYAHGQEVKETSFRDVPVPRAIAWLRTGERQGVNSTYAEVREFAKGAKH
ncbi:hypothetical protein [Metallosphaera javensis (ex Sakai et al. 2022)]|uniref:hypothetical protein n=1 Tax=Metallosphaera javensis (ex Sakai et al. 2022) TaxID=2775498 RepID=UPI00258C3943|nr:MAG: hypothetical protein MjAS7_1649 [Metallosphaera javensis (ex Sakai et al. 2022)]